MKLDCTCEYCQRAKGPLFRLWVFLFGGLKMSERIRDLVDEINDVIIKRPVDEVLTSLLVCLGFAMRQSNISLDKSILILEETHRNSYMIDGDNVSVN